MSLLETNRFARPAAPAPQEVAYPAVFHYRIIAERGAFELPALAAALAVYNVVSPLAPSRASSGGRYDAYSVSVEIRDPAQLHAFDASVKRVAGVRMVL